MKEFGFNEKYLNLYKSLILLLIVLNVVNFYLPSFSLSPLGMLVLISAIYILEKDRVIIKPHEQTIKFFLSVCRDPEICTFEEIRNAYREDKKIIVLLKGNRTIEIPEKLLHPDQRDEAVSFLKSFAAENNETPDNSGPVAELKKQTWHCPECLCEYREGFFECADCKIPLVMG